MRAALVTATLAVTLLLTACAGGDDTVTVEPAEPPGSTAGGTELTIRLDESGAGDAVRTFTLTCDPPGGDHPDPEAACRALADTGGAAAFDPVPDDMMCTEIYGGPQRATVTGTVDGTAVDAEFSRTDGCEIARWDALAPLLGSKGGAEGA
ncbi:hypothetical protein HJG43_14130 [Kineosporiaceae bacterium SCSIO 59966]|nr:hypothetical protein HJG43_14130 [Kineosporiaceae bacterium SCSIO 59966]